jgi:hypothetical protein
MIPEQALEKAKEGGWDKSRGYIDTEFSEEAVALDKTFWIALGKAMGWTLKSRAWNSTHDAATWIVNAQHFYDLILTEQPTENFWAELLS